MMHEVQMHVTHCFQHRAVILTSFWLADGIVRALAVDRPVAAIAQSSSHRSQLIIGTVDRREGMRSGLPCTPGRLMRFERSRL